MRARASPAAWPVRALTGLDARRVLYENALKHILLRMPLIEKRPWWSPSPLLDVLRFSSLVRGGPLELSSLKLIYSKQFLSLVCFAAWHLLFHQDRRNGRATGERYYAMGRGVYEPIRTCEALQA